MDNTQLNLAQQLADNTGVSIDAVITYVMSAVDAEIAADTDAALAQAHLVLAARNLAVRGGASVEFTDGALDQALIDHNLTYPYIGKHRA